MTRYRVDDYFYGHNTSRQPKYDCFTLTNRRSELVVERCQKHLCANPRFVKNFKHRYETDDSRLLKNPKLKAYVKDDTQAI